MHPIIQGNRYLTLATANKKGEAWASPLAYAFDEVKNIFYFYSAYQSRHCQNIKHNPYASICIFNSTFSSTEAEGLQFDVIVEEVKSNLLENVLDYYFTYSFPDKIERKKWLRPIEDFTGEAPQRFYQIQPLNMFINAHEDGIDFRKEIE